MVISTYDEEKINGDVQMVENPATGVVRDPNDPSEISILDSMRANKKVLMYCVMMTTGPLMFGFDNIIVGIGSAMPAFQISYGEYFPATASYILPSIWLSLWNAMSQLGVMVGSVINGPLTDRFGRKFSFLTGGIVSCIAVLIIYFSDRPSDANGRRGMFLAGKIILGVALGILNSTCQTFISEIAPSRLRGPLLSIFQFFLVLGQIVGVGIIYARILIPGENAYRVAFASQWAFAGSAVIVAFIIPESPTFFMKRNNVEGARKSFAKLHGDSTVEASVVALQITLEHERRLESSSDGIGYVECFKGTNWRRTRIILYANAAQQFLGISMVANSTYFMELAGMSPSNSLMVLTIGVALGLPANVISWFTMTIFGRRFILLASSFWVGLCWLSIGIAGCVNNHASLWYIGVMMNMIIFFFGLGVGGTYPVVAAESSSVRLRAKSNSLGFIMNGFVGWAFSFFIPYLYNIDQANWGGKVGFFFGGLSFVAVAVIYLEVPEMKNRTYGELDEMFESRVKTRDFKNYVFQNQEQPLAAEITEKV